MGKVTQAWNSVLLLGVSFCDLVFLYKNNAMKFTIMYDWSFFNSRLGFSTVSLRHIFIEI